MKAPFASALKYYRYLYFGKNRQIKDMLSVYMPSFFYVYTLIAGGAGTVFTFFLFGISFFKDGSMLKAADISAGLLFTVILAAAVEFFLFYRFIKKNYVNFLIFDTVSSLKNTGKEYNKLKKEYAYIPENENTGELSETYREVLKKAEENRKIKIIETINKKFDDIVFIVTGNKNEGFKISSNMKEMYKTVMEEKYKKTPKYLYQTDIDSFNFLLNETEKYLAGYLGFKPRNLKLIKVVISKNLYEKIRNKGIVDEILTKGNL